MRAPKFWTSHTNSAHALAWSLSPFGALYELGGRVKFATTRPYRTPLRVVCVGNLTAGGTGKTPVAIAVAQLLLAKGVRVGFLSRGYRGTLKQPALADPARHAANDAGDEPLLLARVAPTIVSADRVAGAKLAEAAGIETLILDDGFQNPSLAKDLSLVVVDGETGFGNGFVIPAGPLRERINRGLARAQGVVIMGDGMAELPPVNLPVLHARLAPDPAAEMAVNGRKVAAFAGIGRPEKFFASLRAAGANVALARPFPDHYAFTDADWATLAGEAAEYGATLVTTEKDWVRLKPVWRSKCMAFPVRAEFSEPDLLARVLDVHV